MKGDDDNIPKTSFLKLWNFYTGSASSASFYVNDNLIRTGTLAPDSISNYNSLYFGNYKVVVRSEGQTSDLLSEEKNMEADKYYSCFFTGNAANPRFHFVEDDFSLIDSANKIRFRLINMTTAWSSLSVAIDKKSDIISSLPSMSVSKYVLCDIDPALKIKLYNGADRTSPLDSVEFRATSRQTYNLYLYDNKEGKVSMGLRLQIR